MSVNNREQERKFKDLLARLAKSPLYKEKLADYKLSGIGLKHIQTLPLTTKEDLRQAGSFGHLAVEMKDVAQYHESTGTTGEPSASWFTQEDLATGGRQLKECGVRLTAEDFVLIRFPYALALPAFLMQQAAWQSGAGVVPASSRTVVTPYPRVLQLMARLRVTVMAGLPREMELLAETARLTGLQPSKDFPALRAICVAGELVSNNRRKHIEKLWDVPVFNMYGSTETANIATMCEHGAMHIVEEDFFVEVLQENGCGPAAQEERGFAAITTLSHQGSPLLRYFNEDIITVEHSSCACGRTGGKLVHYGRSKDRIRFGDIVLDAADIQEAVYSLSPAPDAWKAVEQENGLHLLLDSHESGKWSEEGVRSQLSNQLKIPVSVEILTDSRLLDRTELVKNLPSTKPVYIQRLSSTATAAQGSAGNLQDLLKRGRQRIESGDFKQSLELFKKAVSVDPQNAEAHAWLAAAYGRLMESSDMLEKMKLLPFMQQEISKAIEINPSLTIVRRINGSILLNTPESLGGKLSAAETEFQYCIERKMDDADIWVSLSECYIKMGKVDQAAEALKEALSREPEHQQARRLLADVQKGMDLEV